MLRSLSIRNVVLIERLDLEFRPGLGVLTGETGSGKSILLDALGLATGLRAERELLRSGAEQAAVTAEFQLADGSTLVPLLEEHGLLDGDGLVLRRVMAADGRSRAFVNDQPVSVTLLRQIGDALVEVSGQFESQGLLNPATHRAFLDTHGGHGDVGARVAACFAELSAAREARARASEALAQTAGDEAYLSHALGELGELDPQPGEEAELAGRRSVMMHAERLMEGLSGAAAELARGDGAEAAIGAALGRLTEAAELADGHLDAVIGALERARIELVDGSAEIDRAAREMELDGDTLERVEERLFALRALARKHGTEVDGLPQIRAALAEKLAGIEDGGARLSELEAAEEAASAAYQAAAEALTKARETAAKSLDGAVSAEFPPLMLKDAELLTRLEPLAEADWNENGRERVRFDVRTNPGTPPGPLHRIASGGELARILLAIKVVLAHADPVPTLIFDEVDSGISGAAAAAVGERLARLAEAHQVLVVTHSPQVAARGVAHWRVSKSPDGGGAATAIEPLDAPARLEEIARMLAGKRITDAARAAAESLLGGAAG